MKVWFQAIVTAMLMLGVGYVGYSWGVTVQKDLAEQTLAQLRTANASLREQLLQAHREENLLADRDAMIDAFDAMDDKGGAFEISEEELKSMESDPSSRDYKQVLRRFVKEKLNKELDSFQTISRTVNPRRLLVTTTDQTAIDIEMKKWNNRGGIWTVERFNDVSLKGNATLGIPDDRYRQMRVEDAPEDVKAWAAQRMASPDWKTEFLRKEGKTYVLIKTSASETDSVELEDIHFWAEEIFVTYQTYDYGKSKDRSLINDYLLIEVIYDAKAGVAFEKSLSVVE
ncbi:hypothetical protein [Brevibacillus sp. H7]|uniref:hypothetical protein n=1 Tax=Brevibacillus sp. H7 TaxID=3349138 RepID=UPI00380C20C3